jgi:hypothetical protein
MSIYYRLSGRTHFQNVPACQLLADQRRAHSRMRLARVGAKQPFDKSMKYIYLKSTISLSIGKARPVKSL